MFRSGVRTRIVVGLGAAAVGLLLGGCSGVPVEEYELAVAENSQLRERISALQDNLQRAETDKRVLQERRAELEGELSGVRSELMETRTQAAVLQANRGPAAEGFEARGNNQVATVAGDLLFASGSATIRKAGREKLDGLARTIQDRFAGRQIRVEGHTDSDPIRKSSWKTNERLSSERALAVEAYLVSKGVDPNRIYSAAMGPAVPRATKEDSRRVEIVVLGG
jgi:chemotaxis protein MotB